VVFLAGGDSAPGNFSEKTVSRKKTKTFCPQTVPEHIIPGRGARGGHRQKAARSPFRIFLFGQSNLDPARGFIFFIEAGDGGFEFGFFAPGPRPRPIAKDLRGRVLGATGGALFRRGFQLSGVFGPHWSGVSIFFFRGFRAAGLGDEVGHGLCWRPLVAQYHGNAQSSRQSEKPDDSRRPKSRKGARSSISGDVHCRRWAEPGPGRRLSGNGWFENPGAGPPRQPGPGSGLRRFGGGRAKKRLAGPPGKNPT